MLDVATLAAFVLAAGALVLAPGPDTAFVLSRSLGAGRVPGVAAAGGVATGILVHTTAAVVGLSALLRTSAAAFTVVKWIGAAYLVFLGVQALRGTGGLAIDAGDGTADADADATADADADATADADAFADGNATPATPATPADSYRGGLLVNVLNPKVALFFLAFLPQFAPAGPGAELAMAGLGAIYAVLTIAYLGSVALLSGGVRRYVLDSSLATWLERATGVVLIGFGVRLVLDDRLPG